LINMDSLEKVDMTLPLNIREGHFSYPEAPHFKWALL